MTSGRGRVHHPRARAALVGTRILVDVGSGLAGGPPLQRWRPNVGPWGLRGGGYFPYPYEGPGQLSDSVLTAQRQRDEVEEGDTEDDGGYD